jgi:hypothetical protein
MSEAFGSVLRYSRNRLRLVEKAFVEQAQDYAVSPAARGVLVQRE